MAQYPEVQRRAQEDIDRLVSNRLPTFDDFDSLPYVRAIIKEIVRWGPVVPLGLPHAVLKDDVYEGYFIPKGTTVIGNIWYVSLSKKSLSLISTRVYRRAMAHDADVYPDPFHFDPSRHLGAEPQLDPFKFIFGFGKRVCPGAHLAELSLFLNVACTLAVFDISKPVDERGNEIEQKIVWTSRIITYVWPGTDICCF
jgi:cytochrome P450